MKRTILAAVLLAGTALISPASADITSNLAVFTSDHCDGGCGPQTGGFATIEGVDHQNGSITITITPLNGNGLVNTGLDTFIFNLVGNPNHHVLGSAFRLRRHWWHWSRQSDTSCRFPS